MPITSDQAVEVLRAAGEATRLRILALLAREELAVLELTRILGQSQPRVSRHLKVLADACLVERFPDGAWVFYRLAAAGPIRGLVDETLCLISPTDAMLSRDAERLGGVAAERASEAAAYFAENAERWDEIRSLYVSEAAVEAAILEAAGAGPFERFIDLGTGAGRMLTLLGGRAASAIGLDLSRQMLNIARTNVARAGLAACELRHGDILGTGLRPGEADLVVVHQVLHYLGEPSAAVAEAARLVAPGGRLLIVDFAPHDLEFLRAEHQHRRLGFADDEIERWLGAAGLVRIAVTALPAAGGAGLTVKIWRAERGAERIRRVA
ncbi:MAG TPA: metalloregulator ArsR/SmtB family transcription factor [Caulobacteraceae bacterium]|nr:metalloregulator ArsR/SmtB family transcription factor [Caulobacteraceae bacterium]